MEFTIALILLAAFALSMILMHKFGGICTAAPAPSSGDDLAAPRAQRLENECYTPATPQDNPQMGPSYLPHGCVTPRSDYAISITDSTAEDLGEPDVPVVTRPTRVISFLRFSGYSQSDVSLADRSTSQSLWSSFSYTTGSECSEVTEVNAGTVATKFTTQPRKPQDVMEGVDVVEIGELDGFKQRNLLSFKPHKPRGLTTKHLKKTKDIKHSPAHTASL